MKKLLEEKKCQGASREIPEGIPAAVPTGTPGRKLAGPSGGIHDRIYPESL